MFARIFLLGSFFLLACDIFGCELCAIYNADAALGKSGKGFSLAISEQFIPYRTVQLNGRELPPSSLDQLFLDKSMTHIVPTWNFSPRFAVSLSLPVVHQR